MEVLCSPAKWARPETAHNLLKLNEKNQKLERIIFCQEEGRNGVHTQTVSWGLEGETW